MPATAIPPHAIICEQPVEFVYRDGLFYCTGPLGTKAMRPSVYFATIAAAVECSREHRPWARPVAEVVSLADHQAATGKSSK